MDVDTASVTSLDSKMMSSDFSSQTPIPTKENTMIGKDEVELLKASSTPDAKFKRRRTHPSPPLVVIETGKTEWSSPTKCPSSKKSKKSFEPSQKRKHKESSAQNSTTALGTATSKFDSERDEIESSLLTLQSHLPNFLGLWNRNMELAEEIKTLKNEAESKEQTMWELEEYNENLKGQIVELKTERNQLQDTLRKIRLLSGADILEIET